MIRLAAALLSLAAPAIADDATPPVTGPIRGAIAGSWHGKCQQFATLDDLESAFGDDLDYRSGGWWTPDGLLIGLALSEDSDDICVRFRTNP